MTSPTDVAHYGFRYQLWLKNTTTGSDTAIDRVQMVDPMWSLRTDGYYELARKGKIGSTQNPPEYRFNIDQNMTDSLEAEYVMAGKSISPAGAQSYNMGDFLTYASKITGYLLQQDNTGAMVRFWRPHQNGSQRMAWDCSLRRSEQT